MQEPEVGHTYSLDTYNEDCTYSWGYKFWNSYYVSENIEGVAGKSNPASSSVIKGNWISNSNWVWGISN